MIKIGSLDRPDSAMTLPLQADSSVSYASGHLLFARDETLMAQPFDPDTRQPKSEAFPLAEHVSTEGSRYVGASMSENGTLVYAHGGSDASTQLTWLDRAGRALATVGDGIRYGSLALAPDERRVAVALGTGSPENLDIWLIDIARGVRSRLTFDPGTDQSPVWSPDGTRIAFGGERSGKGSLRQQSIDRTADEPLFEGASGSITPSGWSPDGRFIAYTLSGSFPRISDVWILPLFGDRQPFPLLDTEFLENSGVFSPDGRWIAYTSDEGGQPNVYVQAFPRAAGKYQVSTDGGAHPVWRADSKELFYLGADQTLMAVSTDASREFSTGPPQALFVTGAPIGPGSGPRGEVYAVTKDGKRILVNARPQQSSVAPVTVVVNWPATIQK